MLVKEQQKSEFFVHCFINFTDFELLRDYCDDLEQSIDTLSKTIEARREFKRLKVESTK